MDWIELEKGKICTSYTFCHHFVEKSLRMNILEICYSIGEIVFLSKKGIYIYIYIYTYLLPHKENIFLWMNKILKNCPYVKSELLIRAYESSPKWTWLICPLIFPFINTRNAENGLASLRGVDLVMLVLSKVNPEVWLKHQLTSIRGFNPLC